MLENIISVINNDDNAKDRDRVFTFIEFIKLYGFENDSNTFLTIYKDYITQWANIKKVNIDIDTQSFVKIKMIDILKSITLNYTSYEEQDFIANIDWTNDLHIKSIIPIFSKRIKEIGAFYRKKRNTISQIIDKNKIKGSTQYIEEIIYNKILDFLFNKSQVISLQEIKKDLLISVENYIDTYSEYFDIPRNIPCTNESRKEFITSNINDVDYKVYLQTENVLADLLFSGDVYLEEIPLIAQININFNAKCVGDKLALKNTLLKNSEINLIPINDQIALKRKLYQKYLGCDLYYLYTDTDKNITMDLMVKSEHPSGNLLNCQTSDTATFESNELSLLSNIGLFFKPDKISIIKINAKSFEWEVDESKLLPDTIYVFPDPSKYGDIGVNKTQGYPLIMQYNLNYDIKNLSSGKAKDDPLLYLDEQAWSSYYTKQQDEFKIIDNIDFSYGFTALANRGFIHNYQTDLYGNQFGLFKGYEEVYDENNKLIKIIVSDKFTRTLEYTNDDNRSSNPILLNGGYFEDPYNPGKWSNGIPYYDVKNGIWNPLNSNWISGKPFDFNKQLRIKENYKWSSIKLKNAPLTIPSIINNYVNYGQFGNSYDVKYEDHYKVIKKNVSFIEDNENVIQLVADDFLTKIAEDDVPVERTHKDFFSLKNDSGKLFIKTSGNDSKPKLFKNSFSWLQDNIKNNNFINFYLISNYIILESKSNFYFINYAFDGNNFYKADKLKENIIINKNDGKYDLLYNEKDNSFYILWLSQIKSSWNPKNDLAKYFLPVLYKFDIDKHKLTSQISIFDDMFQDIYNKEISFETSQSDIQRLKYEIADRELTKDQTILIDKLTHTNWENFKFSYKSIISDIKLSYSNKFNLFSINYIVTDDCNIPFIFEHKFKPINNEYFLDTLETNVYTVTNDVYVYNSSLYGENGYNESNEENLNTQFFKELI